MLLVNPNACNFKHKSFSGLALIMKQNRYRRLCGSHFEQIMAGKETVDYQWKLRPYNQTYYAR